MWNGMHGDFGWAFGGLGMALFWISLGAVVVVVAWLALDRAARREPRQTGESPMDMLKRRYTSGEIGRAEFDEKREQLT